MGVMNLCLFLVLLINATVATETYYVTTDDHASACPEQSMCHNLSHYINNAATYFTDNNTFYFLEGTHKLNDDLEITQITNITLQGYNATIRCVYGLYRIDFRLVDNIKVLSLIIESCKHVLIDQCWNISMFDFSILNNIHGGLLIYNGYNVYIESCRFADNVDYNLQLSYTTTNTSFTHDIYNTSCFYDPHKTFTVVNSSFENTRLHSSLFAIIYFFYPSYQIIAIEFCNFSNTKIYLYSTTVMLHNVVIANNRASGLEAYDSNIHIRGVSNVVGNNSGCDGGGMALYDRSLIALHSPAAILFVNNTASNKGGAIYWGSYHKCANFILTPANSQQINWTLQSNTAAIAGDDFYGLSTASCTAQPGYLDWLQFDPFPVISGDATGVCACDPSGRLTHCNSSVGNGLTNQTTYYPGQSIKLFVVLVSDSINSSLVPIPVVTDGLLEVKINGKTRSILYMTSQCTQCEYVIDVMNHTLFPLPVEMVLQVYDTLQPSSLAQTIFANSITLHINVSACPMGFELQSGTCKCSSYITGQIQVKCNISNGEFERYGPVWMGIYSDQCIVAAHCYLDHCVHNTAHFTLNDTDRQCQYNRAGVLCGQCSEGYSLVLGSNKCKVCSNAYIALVVPFALFGIALVILLIVLNLTVAMGTINGLIFYANIVKLYQPSFFPHKPVPFLSQFISWLNLDFGIEMCFYNSMDSYGKVWLQYIFPLYIWCLIAFIILLCRRSTLASRLMGNNAIPVLATLLLLSYTKLFRAVENALQRLELKVHCPDREETYIYPEVWKADPSIEYNAIKHLVLVIFSSVVLALLGVPFTLFQLFTIQIERYGNRICCVPMLWLKPVIDAYGSPYRDEYKFWTGILLVTRIVLLMAVSFTESKVSLAILASTIAVISTIAYSLGGVYKKKWLNLVEAWFLLNVAVLAILSTISEAVAEIATITSITLVLLTFIVMMGYHIYLKMTDTEVGHKIIQSVKSKLCCKCSNKNDDNDGDEGGITMTNKESRDAVTHTEVTLHRESMIFSDD